MLTREKLEDIARHQTRWTIRKFHSDEHYQAWTRGEADPFDVVEIEGNILLNEGITALQNLLTGAAETAFDNTNAYLGVGNDNTAESASQAGLIDAAPTYKAMEATYPQISSQTTTWRSVFGSDDANVDWNEFTVANGNSNAADNLNRKVSAQGTKASGQTWTLDLSITWS